MLNGALESLVQKVQGGVVLNFEKFGPDLPPLENDTDDGSKPAVEEVVSDDSKPLMQSNCEWHSCRKLILVPRSAQKGYAVGHWPIPEAFWPDPNSPSLPPRTAQPIVRFSCAPCEPMVIDFLPFDKYELEPSPLTQYILKRGQPNVAWQVYIANSAKFTDILHPFGYLKASSSLTSVNIFVMPYNYPVLLPLLDELFKKHKLKPTPQWRQQFDNYLKTLPGYYAVPLRRALGRMGVPNLVPDQVDNFLSYSVINYLKKLKNQAKIEMDRLVASVGQKLPVYENIKVVPRAKAFVSLRKDFSQLHQNNGNDLNSLKQEVQEFTNFTVAVRDGSIQPQYYRNPYDIPRKMLLDQVARMRLNFLQTNAANRRIVDDDQLHSIPVQQMGNYQEYLRRQPSPLREIENQPTRLHTFGNPFKVKQNMMIDEADEAALFGTNSRNKRSSEMSPSSPGSPGPKRRKPGPLPRDISVRRPSTPPPGAMSPSSNSGLSNDSDLDTDDDHPLRIVIDGESDMEVENGILNGEKMPVILESDISAGPIAQPDLTQPVLKNKSDTSIMTTKKLHQIWMNNTRLKHMVVKEVKKPGRHYDKLFSHLNSIQGSLDIRTAFIQDVINEAARFKKRLLIKMLEQYMQSMVQLENKRNKVINNINSHQTRQR